MYEQKKQKMSEGKIELFNCDNMELMAKYPEKPIQLYQWILQNHAKEGDLILDTHLGSYE